MPAHDKKARCTACAAFCAVPRARALFFSRALFSRPQPSERKTKEAASDSDAQGVGHAESPQGTAQKAEGGHHSGNAHSGGGKGGDKPDHGHAKVHGHAKGGNH